MRRQDDRAGGMYQIVVAGQVRAELGDDRGKTAGGGKLERKLLAVLVVELLSSAYSKKLHGNCVASMRNR
jgi:hypothetical protein